MSEARETRAPELVIVSGMSGAGRTTAMKALEDLGFYCVDNLPVVLLDRFVDLFGEGSSRLAVAVDVRERDFLDSFPDVHDRLREQGVLRDLIYLDAADEVLAKRFDETRRVHPWRGSGSLSEDIARERELLAPIAARADGVIDTTHRSVHDLKARDEPALQRDDPLGSPGARAGQLRLPPRRGGSRRTCSWTSASFPTRTSNPSCASTRGWIRGFRAMFSRTPEPLHSWIASSGSWTS